jgi:4-amino-4-deoxy-L-arabinose transferase-like glycosyltransferase
MVLNWIPDRKLRWLLLAVCALHVLLGAAMGLSVDEAHYALYATHLAWSYFDHPPLVGWLQAPLVALDAPVVALRLLPGLLWLGTVLLCYRVTLKLAAVTDRSDSGAWAQKAAMWTLVALAAAPLLHVLGLGLLPDTLLMFFTIAIMAQTLELMQASTVRRAAPWLGMGLLLGLAGLSKYTAIFAAIAVVACLWAAHGLRFLRSPWPWVSLLLALLVVSPVALWNYGNQWASFVYQAKHGAGSVWRFSSLLQFLVVQLVVFGPLMLWAWRGAALQKSRGQRALLLFFLIPLGVLATLSGGGSSLPHWTAPAWVALSPFVGLGLAQSVQGGKWKSVYVLVAVQAAITATLLGLMVSAGLPFLKADENARANAPNPFADLHGWDQAGQRARALAEQNSLNSVAVQNWTLASRMGWYAKPLPVYVLEDRFDQFDIWAGDLARGKDTLLVDWSLMAYEVPSGVHGFERCDLLDTWKVQRFGYYLSTFRFYACRGWSADPQPILIPPDR